jgi:hypothetical protein
MGTGPGAYAIPDGLGKQAVSTRASSGVAVFGTSPRDGGGPKREGPGPGNYFKMEVPGKSAISTVRTVPAFTLRAREKFGSVDDSGTKEFPGPGAYAKIVNPKQRTAPAFSMATRSWAPDAVTVTPGPGVCACVHVCMLSLPLAAFLWSLLR